MEDALDECGISEWDDLVLYVFNEVTMSTVHYSLLCDMADTGDAKAAREVEQLLQQQHSLLRASGFSSRSDLLASIIGPELLERVRTWYFQGIVTSPTEKFTIIYMDSPPSDPHSTHP